MIIEMDERKVLINNFYWWFGRKEKNANKQRHLVDKLTHAFATKGVDLQILELMNKLE